MTTTLPMPATTQRAHAEPAWKGDRLAALADVAALPAGKDGIRAADRNFQWAWEDPTNPVTDQPGHGRAYCLHYATPAKNNYTFILDGRKVRPMTADEHARPILKWSADDVRKWRRDNDPASERPATYFEMVTEAVRLGVVICAELKSSAFTNPGPALQLVQAAKNAGHPPWYMALYKSMPYAREKCAAIVNSGGQFAVIFGKFQQYRPDYHLKVTSWPVKPTRVW